MYWDGREPEAAKSTGTNRKKRSGHFEMDSANLALAVAVNYFWVVAADLSRRLAESLGDHAKTGREYSGLLRLGALCQLGRAPSDNVAGS